MVFEVSVAYFGHDSRKYEWGSRETKQRKKAIYDVTNEQITTVGNCDSVPLETPGG